MLDEARELSEFVLEKLPGESLERQAKLYRQLASLEPKKDERTRLIREALACENLIAMQTAHARRHHQLVLDFQRRVHA